MALVLYTETLPLAPAIIRGEVVSAGLVPFGGRNGDLQFAAPDPMTLLRRLPMGNPQRLADLHAISVDEIVEYLRSLGDALTLARNEHLQASIELSMQTAPTTPPLVRNQYERLPSLFTRDALEDTIDQIGRPFLDRWVHTRTAATGAKRYVRAFGARSIHVVAGNSPVLSAVTVIRNAVARSDAIIKAPSNDPFTGIAIARTMIDMAPDHPITRHLSVAYWRGGDEAFESQLYQPHNIDKIVAWGGFASVKHVSQYLQPGLELVTLDPKRSISIVGKETFAEGASIDEAAQRIAADVGAHNQEVCASARVIYVESGTDEAGIARVSDLAKRVYDRMMVLPERISTKPKHGIDRELKKAIDAASMLDDFYEVVGGGDGEGAMIVSKLPEPVDFAPTLINRVANLVPVDSLDEIFPRIDSYTQTVGIYPEQLAPQIADKVAIAGGQRLVSLGFAGATMTGFGGPQDGLEPTRRLVKWIFREEVDPKITRPIWVD